MSFSDLEQYIGNLPAVDSPDLFGMTENAERAHREDQGKALITSILRVQPRITTHLIGLAKLHTTYVLNCNALEFS